MRVRQASRQLQHRGWPQTRIYTKGNIESLSVIDLFIVLHFNIKSTFISTGINKYPSTNFWYSFYKYTSIIIFNMWVFFGCRFAL